LPVPRSVSICEWSAIALIAASSFVGVVLFGGVRVWSVTPLMALCFAGIAVTFGRLAAAGGEIRIPPGGRLYLAFLLYGVALAPRAAVPYEARFELLKVASCAGAYWAWTELVSRAGRWRWLLAGILLGVTVLAWYAIIQQAHGARMVLNLERPAVYGMRASGTHFCPNHFANLMEIVFPFAAALAVSPGVAVPLRLLSVYAFVLFLPVMFLTQSRSGWLGTAVGVAAALLILAARKGWRRFLGTLVAGAVALAVVFAVAWCASPMVRERITGASITSPDPAVHARFLMWRDTAAMIRESPWTGHGPGSFPWVYPRFRTITMQFFFNHAHNEYLEVAAEYGLAGVALFGAFVGWALIRSLAAGLRSSRDRDAALVAALVGATAACLVHAIFDYNLRLYANTHVLALVAGATAACLYASGRLTPRPLRAAGRILCGAAAAVSLALAVLSVQMFVSFCLTHLGERYRLAVRLEEAGKQFARALRIDPGNWAPYLGMGETYRTRAFWNLDAGEKARLGREALDWYGKAADRNAREPAALFGMSRAYNALGEDDRALTALERAVAMDTNHLFYITQYGLQLRRMGRLEDALGVFRDVDRKWGGETAMLNIALLQKALAEKRAADSGEPAPAGAP
jgi:O-antigen ligase